MAGLFQATRRSPGMCRHTHRRVSRDMRVEKCVETCVATCAHTALVLASLCADMCAHICTDTCTNMRHIDVSYNEAIHNHSTSVGVSQCPPVLRNCRAVRTSPLGRVARLHRWPYCTGGHIARVATLHGWPFCAKELACAYARPLARTHLHTCPPAHLLTQSLTHSVTRHSVTH